MTATEITLRIIFAVVIVLAGLVIGLVQRRWLVRRLKKTVLDEWLTQVLGVIIVLPMLLIAGAVASGVATNGVNQLLEFLSNLGTTTGIKLPDIIEFGKNAFLSLLIIVFAIGVARTFSRLTMRGIGEHRLEMNLRVLIHRVSYIVVLLIAVFWILAIWNVAIALPVAVLGTLTIAITFSVQDILKDLVAGLYILVEHPFFIGDQISMANYTGKVVAVELRATRLRLVSGEEVTIPNALVFGGVVINNSRYTERRATIVVSLPLEDFEREETPLRMINRVKEQEDVLEKPEPGVTVSGIVDNRVELTLRFWVANGQLVTVTEVVYALRTLFPSANLSVKETAGDV
ncbi:MAG TPA: mechanosensitive ion channel domain-containing protein [Ktedonobacteraceae bacterium]